MIEIIDLNSCNFFFQIIQLNLDIIVAFGKYMWTLLHLLGINMAYCLSLIFTIPVAVWITLSMVRYFTLRHTMLSIVPRCLIHIMHVTWCILFIATWRTYWLSGSDNVQPSHNMYLFYNKALIFCCGELQAIGSQPNKNRVCVFIFILLHLVKGLYI